MLFTDMKKPLPKVKNKTAREGDSSIALTFKIVVVALAITGLATLAFALRYVKIQAAEPDFNSIVCDKDNLNCTKTEVAYANLRVYACNQYVAFPPEQGNPLGHHTHETANKVHWHQSYPVDPKSKEPLQPLNRTVDLMLRDMSYDLPEKCDGQEAKTIVTINGVEAKNSMQSVWDHDDIVMITRK